MGSTDRICGLAITCKSFVYFLFFSSRKNFEVEGIRDNFHCPVSSSYLTFSPIPEEGNEVKEDIFISKKGSDEVYASEGGGRGRSSRPVASPTEIPKHWRHAA